MLFAPASGIGGKSSASAVYAVPEHGQNGEIGKDDSEEPHPRLPHYRRALPTAEVVIDAGHGGIDGGSSHEDVLEKDINLAVARKVYTRLSRSGIRVVLNRTGDYAPSDENKWHRSPSRHRRDLSQRSQLTKEIETRLLVSLHVNWSSSPGARGPSVLHQKEGQSALLAFFIQDALNRQQGRSGRSSVGKTFYLLNVVKQPAVIVELGFISNDADRRMLTDSRRQEEVASAIASGVRNYLLFR